jgi:hypothetical protein
MCGAVNAGKFPDCSRIFSILPEFLGTVEFSRAPLQRVPKGQFYGSLGSGRQGSLKGRFYDSLGSGMQGSLKVRFHFFSTSWNALVRSSVYEFGNLLENFHINIACRKLLIKLYFSIVEKFGWLLELPYTWLAENCYVRGVADD